MASVTASSVLPVRSFVSAKQRPSSKISPVVFLDSSSTTSRASSRSAVFRNRFSTLSSNKYVVPLKSRSFAIVYARAATEKTIYDFTVKWGSTRVQES